MISSKIPYDLVSTRLNFWYTAIKNNLINEAEQLKREVEQLIMKMEENQDILLYYQLLDFRHELMLSYMNAKGLNEVDEILEQLRQNEGNLTGMLEYYFFFFMGMYEFRRKELVAAITSYRRAEKSLEYVDDEIEHAEFYYKMAEIYYYMKQTYISLEYVKRAIYIYNKYDNYIDRVLRCKYVIAGNLIDSLNYKGALERFKETLKISQDAGRQLHIATSKLNIGICYNHMGEYEEASRSLLDAYEYFKKENHNCIEKTLFNLAHVQAKKGNIKSAKVYYEKGYAVALERGNSEYIIKLDLLKALYLTDGCYNLIDESFDFFLARKMYGDIEEFAFEVAEVFRKNGDLERSAKYYREVIFAKNQIQKGDMISETQIGNLIAGSGNELRSNMG
ncbi:Rap family tetratricopeptide repeat protein [Bacillus sp. SIMBA_154]|uniref:Rap family tetratricopeptide repeat protein n=1 Tax=Bacillus sp. SIMBA_154 TaxID=3080859 RepID=UPI00397831DA